MKPINLKPTFLKIFEYYKSTGEKPTAFAKKIGFSTTTQLQNVVKGKSALSDKAIIGLIQNLNVNPMYLFFGSGAMFMTDEDELLKLRKENQELHDKLDGYDQQIAKLKQQLARELRKNDQLQEVNATMMEFYKMKLGGHENPDDDIKTISEEDM